jgi:hypothetical protein
MRIESTGDSSDDNEYLVLFRQIYSDNHLAVINDCCCRLIFDICEVVCQFLFVRFLMSLFLPSFFVSSLCCLCVYRLLICFHVIYCSAGLCKCHLL